LNSCLFISSISPAILMRSLVDSLHSGPRRMMSRSRNQTTKTVATAKRVTTHMMAITVGLFIFFRSNAAVEAFRKGRARPLRNRFRRLVRRWFDCDLLGQVPLDEISTRR